MNIHQILVAVLFAVDILINLLEHGRDKNEKYNFWRSIVNVFIWTMILKGGGFF
jgi:hypothetical protein